MQTALLERIIQRHFSKKITFDPLLHQTFTQEELELIFEHSRKPEHFENEINVVNAFIKSHHIVRAKEMLKLYKTLFPTHITGLYDAKHRIQISTDLSKDEVVIEQEIEEDETQKRLTCITKRVSPSELVAFYRCH
jgi:hypothetical protein